MPSKITLLHGPCPSCTSSDAYCEYTDGHGYCYACTYFKPKDREDFSELNEFTYEYLPWRGISKDVFAIYNVKTKINSEGKPVEIGFPYDNGAIQVRSLETKSFRVEKGPNNADINKAGLFGKHLFPAGSHKYLSITEGHLDALSLYQVLRSPVVAVRSASTAVSDLLADRSYCNSFERIYLAFDDDKAGASAATAVAKLFDYNKIYVLKFAPKKDANEYLQAGAADALATIWHNARKYQPENVVSSLDEFKEILFAPPTPSIPYPFPTWNKMLYGIRKGESVLITAPEGVGKTEIMHTIEHKILKETDDAVGAIFLEEPKKDHLESIAGIELGRRLRLPEYRCSPDETFDALRRVVQKDQRLHVYSHFGSDDPEVLLDTIRYMVSASGCGYVLFDHISMAVSALAGEDERKALDYLSSRLEMMLQELNFGLIFVSHVNDFGQTRGSRFISKVANIRIDLTRDVENNSKEIISRITKNRFSSTTGYAGKIVFDPVTGLLTEDIGFSEALAANDNYPPTEMNNAAA